MRHRPVRASGAPAAAVPPAEGGVTRHWGSSARSRSACSRVRARRRRRRLLRVELDAPGSRRARSLASPAPRAGGLLRFDDDVPVADLDPAGRAERNALRLGAAALSMRARGARAGRRSARAPARRLRDAEGPPRCARPPPRARREIAFASASSTPRRSRCCCPWRTREATGRVVSSPDESPTRRVATRRNGRRGRCAETRCGVVAAGRRPVRRRAEFRTGPAREPARQVSCAVRSHRVCFARLARRGWTTRDGAATRSHPGFKPLARLDGGGRPFVCAFVF